MQGNKLKILLTICLMGVFPLCWGGHFAAGASYDVCFTPANNCANTIIKAIRQAKEQILVQAYIFNDRAIAKALVQAKREGIDVRVILERSKAYKQDALINFFNKNKVNIIIADNAPAIIHNKVIIIDTVTTITGSYNYSNGARKNAENVVVINDSGFTKKYIANWHEWAQQGISFNE